VIQGRVDKSRFGRKCWKIVVVVVDVVDAVLRGQRGLYIVESKGCY
jgi:hypothetical protein